MENRIIVGVFVAMAVVNWVLTYSCHQNEIKEIRDLSFAVADAINMIDDNLHFEHKEE